MKQIKIGEILAPNNEKLISTAIMFAGLFVCVALKLVPDRWPLALCVNALAVSMALWVNKEGRKLKKGVLQISNHAGFVTIRKESFGAPMELSNLRIGSCKVNIEPYAQVIPDGTETRYRLLVDGTELLADSVRAKLELIGKEICAELGVALNA